MIIANSLDRCKNKLARAYLDYILGEALKLTEKEELKYREIWKAYSENEIWKVET